MTNQITYYNESFVNKINKNNNKLTRLFKNKSNNKLTNNKIKETLLNVKYEENNSHILDSNFIKNTMINYYHSFDNKLMNSKNLNLKIIGKKWQFMKNQFWNIFE